VVTDFGADVSFQQAAGTWYEPEGVTLSVETIRQIVEGQAQALFDAHAREEDWPTEPGTPWLVAERDGGMVPIVTADPAHPDHRGGKRLAWNAATWCLVHPRAVPPLMMAGPFQGVSTERDVNASTVPDKRVSERTRGCMRWATGPIGSSIKSTRHSVNRANSWSISPLPVRLWAPRSPAPTGWLDRQPSRLKTTPLDAVLVDLAHPMEPATVADPNAPVRAAQRDFSHRREQFDDQGAREHGLPIGSGEIESAHRYVVQQRLKRPGVWWTVEPGRSHAHASTESDQWPMGVVLARRDQASRVRAERRASLLVAPPSQTSSSPSYRQGR
jgi:hypothetical protein